MDDAELAAREHENFIAAIGQVERHGFTPVAAQTVQLEAALKERRPVYLDGRWHGECPVYDRERLGAGAVVRGPAIIEEFGSTTVVLPGWTASVDRWGNLRMES